jgi:hypothetical protein
LKVGFPTSPEALGHVPDFAGDAGAVTWRWLEAMVGKPKHVIGQSKGTMETCGNNIEKNRETRKHMGKTWEYIWENPLSMEVLMGKIIEQNG